MSFTNVFCILQAPIWGSQTQELDLSKYLPGKNHAVEWFFDDDWGNEKWNMETKPRTGRHFWSPFIWLQWIWLETIFLPQNFSKPCLATTKAVARQLLSTTLKKNAPLVWRVMYSCKIFGVPKACRSFWNNNLLEKWVSELAAKGSSPLLHFNVSR